MLVFSTQLCELLPLSPSLWFNSPPLLCVNKYTAYTYTMCKGGVWGSGPQTDKHLPQSPFTGQFFRGWYHNPLLESRGGGGYWVVLETVFCRSLTLCFWSDSEPRKLHYHPKQKPWRGGGLRQIKTCRKVILQANFFLENDVGIAFYQSYLSEMRLDEI